MVRTCIGGLQEGWPSLGITLTLFVSVPYSLNLSSCGSKASAPVLGSTVYKDGEGSLEGKQVGLGPEKI